MSRQVILDSIRRGLRRGPLPADQRAMLEGRLAAHPRQLIPARSRVSRPEQIALFLRNLEKEFATFERVTDEAEVPGAVAAFLARHNLPSRFAIAPMLSDLPWADRPMLMPEARRADPSDLVCLTQGFAGIAETGTLMLPSDPRRPTTLNLLPDTAMVMLRASDVVGAYEEAWDRLRSHGPPGAWMPRNVMLVTGPSRSADIEQTLELGAHGPRRLHVLLVDDEPGAIS